MVHPVHIRRGLSDQGIGEGPGAPIGYGEQYLHADSPVAEDGELLRTLRPWMALDLPARVQEDYRERLEGWSMVEIGQRVFVTRLGWAPPFDRRQAYFSHAMGWPTGGHADPGALLGRTAAFEASWSGSPPSTSTPELSRFSLPWALSEHQEAAQVMLAHMLASASSGAVLILATRRYGSFTVGAPLTGLVAFSRAALPADVRRGYNVRLPAGQPELYLTPGEPCARLIGIHQDDAVSAIRAAERLGQGVVLLEVEPGELPKQRHGDTPDDAFAAYAKHFVTQAAGSDDVLEALPALTRLADAARGRSLSQRWLRSDEGQRWLRSIRNLGFLAVAGQDPERLHSLFTRFLARVDKQAEARAALLPWERVVPPEAVQALSPDTLVELIFSNNDGPGSLGDWASTQAARLGLRLTAEVLQPRLAALSVDEAATRIIELTGRQTVSLRDAVSLYAPEHLWALEDDALAARLLEFEHKAGVLGRRAGELGPLTALALRHPGVFQTLLAETLGGGLSPEWLEPALAQASLDTDALERLLLQVADHARPGERWRVVAGQLVRMLLERGGGSSALLGALNPMATALATGDLRDLERALDALSLADQIEPGRGAGLAQMIFSTELLERFNADERALVMERLQRGELKLRAFAVYGSAWHLPVRWVAASAEWLSQDAAVLEDLSVEALTALSPLRLEPPGPPAQRAVVRELDRRMLQGDDARRRCVEALTRLDHFHLWLRGTGLPQEELRAALITWLSWPDPSARLASQASWDEPIERLQQLRGLDMFEAAEVLHPSHGPRWPELRSFPDHQLQGFLGCVRDREVLCMVADLQIARKLQAPQGARGVGWLLKFVPRDRPLSERMLQELMRTRRGPPHTDERWYEEARAILTAEDVALSRKTSLLSDVVKQLLGMMSPDALSRQPAAGRLGYVQNLLTFLISLLMELADLARTGERDLPGWGGSVQQVKGALGSAGEAVGRSCLGLLEADAGVLPPLPDQALRGQLLATVLRALAHLGRLDDAPVHARLEEELRALAIGRRPPPQISLTSRALSGATRELETLLGKEALQKLDEALAEPSAAVHWARKGVSAPWSREARALGLSALARFLQPPAPAQLRIGPSPRGHQYLTAVEPARAGWEPADQWAWSLCGGKHKQVAKSLKEASAAVTGQGDHPIDALVRALRRFAVSERYGQRDPSPGMVNLRADGRAAVHEALHKLAAPLAVLQVTPGSAPDLPFLRLYGIVGRARGEGLAVGLCLLPQELAGTPHEPLLRDPRWWEGLLCATSSVQPLPGDAPGSPSDARASLYFAVVGGEAPALRPPEIRHAFETAWRCVTARDPWEDHRELN